jgi:hypothetical protein
MIKLIVSYQFEHPHQPLTSRYPESPTNPSFQTYCRAQAPSPHLWITVRTAHNIPIMTEDIMSYAGDRSLVLISAFAD